MKVQFGLPAVLVVLVAACVGAIAVVRMSHAEVRLPYAVALVMPFAIGVGVLLAMFVATSRTDKAASMRAAIVVMAVALLAAGVLWQALNYFENRP